MIQDTSDFIECIMHNFTVIQFLLLWYLWLAILLLIFGCNYNNPTKYLFL